MNREMMRWLSLERCSHALTLAANRPLTVPKLRKMVGSFFLQLERQVMGRRNVFRTPTADRLFAVGFIEHPETNIHIHMALRIDGWCPSELTSGIGERLEAIWRKITGGAGSVVLRRIWDGGWSWYITKYADVGTGDWILAGDYHPQR